MSQQHRRKYAGDAVCQPDILSNDRGVDYMTKFRREADCSRRRHLRGGVAETTAMARMFTRCNMALLALSLAAVLLACDPSIANASVSWDTQLASEPSSFSAVDAAACEAEKKCDRYDLLVQNTGDQASDENDAITLTDTLPPGIKTLEAVGEKSAQSGHGPLGGTWSCNEGTGNTAVSCSLGEPVRAGAYAPALTVIVGAPPRGASGTLMDKVTVGGGGATANDSTMQEREIGSPLGFEVDEFRFAPQVDGGAPALTAGSHPWELTTGIEVPSGNSPPHGVGGGSLFAPARNMRSVAVELPAGFLGYPLATERCAEAALVRAGCGPGSQVGTVALLDGQSNLGFAHTGDGTLSAVYNLVPEHGYVAEFGFIITPSIPVILYANVVRTGSGYRLRISAPAVPATLETMGAVLTFFGDPGRLNGSGAEAAFLSDPSDCAAEEEGLSDGVDGTAPDFESRLELEPWGELGHVVSAESMVYPSLTGCPAVDSLLFHPLVGLAPSPSGGESASEEGTSVADEPSAYSFDLKVPQASGFSEPATPDVRDVSVTLPEGVSADPSSATELVGCQEAGSEGINIGSNDIGAHGQDLGNPEATELGEGHEGGNSSPYDDGFYHAAVGHCPPASVLGAVEVCTPLLANRVNRDNIKEEGVRACEEEPGIAPLKGEIYLAQPRCGGEQQPACTEASATDGELFSGYIEMSGSGVIVKLPGTISADPATGRLTATFKESPQFPFSEFRLHFKGGPRAPVANPQTCGSFATNSTLTSWAGGEVFRVDEPFVITGCGGSMPFSPSFTAATGSGTAGGDTPFVLSFSRQDREQDFSGLTETMPAGLVGKIAGIPQCPEVQANAGTCGAGSEIGTASVLAGAGPEPFSLTGGHVYLTGPYHGAPFGLSIVVPAKAGPFNLGNEVVRAAININPDTAQVTATTNPIPQSKDGVPFRLRSITTEINRSGFLRNATNCGRQSVTATITAAQGASANVSSQLTPTGCASLPFAPTLTESTRANASKANGASLTVTAAQKPGEANIQKVDLQLPVSLPSRLTTLQKACTEAQFNTNPAGCPEGSDIGTGKAVTPLLNVPLEGPAYLVSHGGAAFPDVEFVLQGENVTIVLDGKTDIKKGITYSDFETLPDAPDNSFTANFPEGPHSALSAYGSLCAPTKTVTVKKRVTRRVHGHNRHITINVKKTIAKPLVSPTTIVGQNGAVIKQTTKITVTGCPKPKPAAKPAKKAKAKHKTIKK